MAIPRKEEFAMKINQIPFQPGLDEEAVK